MKSIKGWLKRTVHPDAPEEQTEDQAMPWRVEVFQPPTAGSRRQDAKRSGARAPTSCMDRCDDLTPNASAPVADLACGGLVWRMIDGGTCPAPQLVSWHSIRGLLFWWDLFSLLISLRSNIQPRALYFPYYY
jgi:hypothetical protein